MLHRAHVEARLLTQLRDAGAVVVAELAAAEDRVGHLGLKTAGLISMILVCTRTH